MGGGNQLQFFQRLDPALGLFGFAGLGFEAGNEFLQVRHLGLLLVVHFLLQGQLLGPLAFKIGIAATVVIQLLPFDVQDLVYGGIQKCPVVGNYQQGAGLLHQIALQPEDGVQVQVVGGLIEQQQVCVSHQYLRQVKAHAPAPGKA